MLFQNGLGNLINPDMTIFVTSDMGLGMIETLLLYVQGYALLNLLNRN